jgi:hypothetical protein
MKSLKAIAAVSLIVLSLTGCSTESPNMDQSKPLVETSASPSPTSDPGSGPSSLGLGYGDVNQADCTFNGKPLYGRVYFTNDSWPEADFKVYVTNESFESDLKVYMTPYWSEARSCGMWHLSESWFDSDFIVYLTDDSFESDFKIYETDYGFEAGR